MKGYSFAFTLILLSIVGCIYSQKSTELYEHNDGEDIALESEDTTQDYENPADLEFVVEVQEQTPDSLQMAPEVLVVDDKRRHKTRKNGKDVEVMTDIPVNMAGSSHIGDIELDIGVADQTHKPKTPLPKAGWKRTTKGVKNFQNLPTDSPFTELDTVSDQPSTEDTSSESSSSENSTSDSSSDWSSSNDTSSESSSSEKAFPGASDQPIPKESEASEQPLPPDSQESRATLGGGFTQLPKRDFPDTKSTQKPEKVAIWPIILLAVVFNILIIIGIVWYFKKTSDEEEKKIEAAKVSAHRPPQPVSDKSKPTQVVTQPPKPSSQTQSTEAIAPPPPLDAAKSKEEEPKTTKSKEETKASKSSEEPEAVKSSEASTKKSSSEELKIKSSEDVAKKSTEVPKGDLSAKPSPDVPTNGPPEENQSSELPEKEPSEESLPDVPSDDAQIPKENALKDKPSPETPTNKPEEQQIPKL